MRARRRNRNTPRVAGLRDGSSAAPVYTRWRGRSCGGANPLRGASGSSTVSRRGSAADEALGSRVGSSRKGQGIGDRSRGRRRRPPFAGEGPLRPLRRRRPDAGGERPGGDRRQPRPVRRVRPDRRDARARSRVCDKGLPHLHQPRGDAQHLRSGVSAGRSAGHDHLEPGAALGAGAGLRRRSVAAAAARPASVPSPRAGARGARLRRSQSGRARTRGDPHRERLSPCRGSLSEDAVRQREAAGEHGSLVRSARVYVRLAGGGGTGRRLPPGSRRPLPFNGTWCRGSPSSRRCTGTSCRPCRRWSCSRP